MDGFCGSSGFDFFVITKGAFGALGKLSQSNVLTRSLALEEEEGEYLEEVGTYLEVAKEDPLAPLEFETEY